MIKLLLFSIGVVSLVLGVIGIFVPLLPTTPFLLLSAWCFLRSSERAHRWLYKQPYIGDALRDWDTNKSIKRRTKIIAVGFIALSASGIILKVENDSIRIPVLILLVFVSAFILSRSEK